jgi:3-hydroxyacyl-CoA dehydrogenase
MEYDNAGTRQEIGMKRTLRRAAVLGAGTMGSQIAAHFANAGVPCLLLDMKPLALTEEEAAQGLSLEHPDVRNRLSRQGLERAKSIRPAAFFDNDLAELITIGNFEDDLYRLREVDWVVEAVVEDLQAKRDLMARVAQVVGETTVVTTNTSGLPIREIARDLPQGFRRRFFGTHFFNPPRYMKLVEIIATPEADLDLVGFVEEVCDRTLGKRTVRAKDTPNFIANRIGIYAMAVTLRAMLESGLTVEEVDALTGELVAHPRTATFRLADLVGIDVLVHVMDNIYQNAPYDEERETFRVPQILRTMLERGLLGDKTGQGFYKRVSEEGTTKILALDLGTLEYRPQRRPSWPHIDAIRNLPTAERLKALTSQDSQQGRFLWHVTSRTINYAARRVPEIADRLVEVDRAMRWGFNWELGPFETWDVLGLQQVAERLREEGVEVAPLAIIALQAGSSFYKKEPGKRYYFEFESRGYIEIEHVPGIVELQLLKEERGTVRSNPSASLVDLGDGVLCLEFHSKMNALGPDAIGMIHQALHELEANFEALVIGNQGEAFSAGANLMLILMAAQEQDWDELELAVRKFQRANMAIKYATKPVVVAAHGITVGGGCEIALHGARTQAAAETYMGLVETGVGLIPAGGGTKEALVRAIEPLAFGDRVDPLPFLQRVFENIGLAKVSSSALEARRLGYLRTCDNISMNRDRLIADAKAVALTLARTGYRPPVPRPVYVTGADGFAALKLGLHLMRKAGRISEYDEVVGEKLARVLTGGNMPHPGWVTEEYLLDLEREAFLSLCGQQKTLARMEHMLKTGRPLRN